MRAEVTVISISSWIRQKEREGGRQRERSRGERQEERKKWERGEKEREGEKDRG